MSKFVLAIDQGTTSSRAILFRADTSIAAAAQKEFPQHFPASGWVEHEPEDLWATTLSTSPRGAGARRGERVGYRCDRHHQPARDHRALGSSRRAKPSTARSSGRTGARRSFARASRPRATRNSSRRRRASSSIPTSPAPRSPGSSTTFRAPASARQRGELAFGTVDSYLLWRLTGGAVHATDATNASRTLLFDIHSGDWDDELLDALRHSESPSARSARFLGEPTAAPPPACSAGSSRSAASRATSRPRPSARPASGPAWSSRPTAPAASPSSIPARRRSRRATSS